MGGTMVKVFIAASIGALLACSVPAVAQNTNAKKQQAAKKPTYEECQKRSLAATGGAGRPDRKATLHPESSFMAQCMAGKI